MASLACIWLIIELKIIPNGFLKWVCLSFYIHPLFLFFCQIFLWLNELRKWVAILILLPFKITLFVSLLISKFLKRVGIILFSFAIKKTKILEFFPDHEVNEQGGGGVNLREFDSGAATSNTDHDSSTPLIVNRPRLIWDSDRQWGANLAQPELRSSQSSWLDEFLLSDNYAKYVSKYSYESSENLSSPLQEKCLKTKLKDSLSDNDTFHPSYMNQGFSLELQDFEPQLFLDEEKLSTSSGGENSCNPNEYPPSPIIAMDQEQQLSSKILEKDGNSCSFNQTYTERMRWFDVLYHDRLCGLMPTVGYVDSTNEIPSTKTSRIKILRSLEGDLELVYVAKLCLIWEALRYQYQKVESLALSDDILLFHANISDKFQKFKIILERFMEGEKCHQGKKNLDFICDRISLKGLLQIPNVTGPMEKEENRSMVGEAMMEPNEVLKVIEKCIKVFRLYVEKDHKNDTKYVRRFKVISWRTTPPVEDPRDLNLLYDLTNALKKKLLLLNGMQAKKKCWFRRRVKPVQEECDGNSMDLVLGAIDLELVRKVMKMSTISTNHLTWCQHKLNHVEFKQGRIFRTPTTYNLFPSS